MFDIKKYSFNNILQDALSYVPDTMDKREGSVIYDALAPVCHVLAEHCMAMYQAYLDTYAITATGSFLDLKVGERGLTRYHATYAVKLGHFSKEDGTAVEVPLGSRFATLDDTNPIYYTVTAVYTIDGVVQPGYYELTCETPGVVGNSYTGDLVNVNYVSGVQIARIEQAQPLVPARDEETDEELKIRYYQHLKAQAFGGNIQDYIEMVEKIDGAGACQVYPVWNGGGTVKLSVISPDYQPIIDSFIVQIKEYIDPTDYEGEGIGQAPIGHKVTVTTATPVSVDVSFDLEHTPTYTMEEMRTNIEAAIENYLLSIRKEWGVMTPEFTYVQKVYIAQVMNAILDVPGVVNVLNLKLNESDLDITLTESTVVQEIPVLGTVTINE